MADAEEDASYVLYVFPFSLYSLMVRFTVSLGTAAAPGDASHPIIERRLVNLHRDDNVAEWYLTRISSKGQVPAMVGGRLSAPLTESLDISKFLCEYHFQGLMPSRFRETMDDLMGRLHEINGMSLSVTASADEFPEGIPIASVDELLSRDDISPEYRAALEAKKAL